MNLAVISIAAGINNKSTGPLLHPDEVSLASSWCDYHCLNKSE